ncbi:MAG: DUF3224 domain-containing protein [Marinicella sp.]|nr:DUF3224 domain-containing protein [Xanthomonadales bacterium]
MKITGTFKVNMQPQALSCEGKENIQLSRFALDKTYEGTLSATSQGEMLSAMTTVQGSAGYVAIEQVVGTLKGKKGSFVLQHYGTMSQGDSYLKLEVVPDSGSGDLKGLSGAMNIRIEDGQHYYDFEYSLD